MALVSVGFQATVTLVDTGGNESNKQYEVRGATFADAATNVLALLTDIALVSDAIVKGYRVSQVFANDAFAYPADAEIENQALIIVRLATNPTKTASVLIPAPKDTLFVGASGPTYNVVDMADANVLGYIGNFLAAGTCFISDGEDMAVDGGISGHRIHRQSNRG